MKLTPHPPLLCPLRPGRPLQGRSERRVSLGPVLVLFWSALTASLCAPALPPGPPGRYLLLVETSEAMRPRAAATVRAVETLLASGMHGQFRSGDTLGVWTYNEDLHAGTLPLQVWTPQTGPLVTSNVVAFLKSQPGGNVARLAAAWPELEELVRESPRLTVIWVTSGGEPIRGTPFDPQINEFFSAHAREQERARMPFLIVLRAQQGEFCGVMPNLAPWPVLLPSFPPWLARAQPTEPKPAEPATLTTPASKPAEAKPAEKAPTATPSTAPARAEPIVRPPLILVGKKDESPPPPPPAAEVVPPKPATPAPLEETKVAPTSAPTVEPSTPLAPTLPSVAKSPTVPTEPTSPSAVTPAPSPPELGAKPATEPVPGPSGPESPPEAAAPVIAPTGPPTAPLVAETKPTVQSPGTSPLEPATTLPAALPSTQPAATVATATPDAATAKSLRWAWVAGGICAAGAVGVWFFIRRLRAAHRASLITRSMEAQRRPPR